MRVESGYPQAPETRGRPETDSGSRSAHAPSRCARKYPQNLRLSAPVIAAENVAQETDWSGRRASNPHPRPRRRPRPDEPFELHTGQAMPARTRRTGFRWPPGKQGSSRAVVTCVAEQARGVSGGDGAQPRPKRPRHGTPPVRDSQWTPGARGWCRRPDLNRGPTDYESAGPGGGCVGPCRQHTGAELLSINASPRGD